MPATCFVGPRRGGDRAQRERERAAALAVLAALRDGSSIAVVESLSFGRTYPDDSPAASVYDTEPCRAFSPGASGKLAWREMAVSEMRAHDLEHASLRAVVKLMGGGGGGAGEGEGEGADEERGEEGPQKKQKKQHRKQTKQTKKKGVQTRTLELMVRLNSDSPETSACFALGHLIDRSAAAAPLLSLAGSSPSPRQPRVVEMGGGKVGLELEVSLLEAAFDDPDEKWEGDASSSSSSPPARFGWDETDRAKAAAAAGHSSLPHDDGAALPPQPVRRRGNRAAQEDGEALVALLQAALTLHGGGSGGVLRLGPDCDGGLNALSRRRRRRGSGRRGERLGSLGGPSPASLGGPAPSRRVRRRALLRRVPATPARFLAPRREAALRAADAGAPSPARCLPLGYGTRALR